MMGPGIAAVLAIGGLQATLVSRSQEGAAQGLEQALARIETLKVNKLLDDELAAEAAKRLGTTANLEEAAGGADIFIESGPENLAWKQDFFEKLDKTTGTQAVLASNTSGLSITAIARQAQHRGRILTTHFWNPPHLVPLVEIVKAEHTDDEVALRVRDLLAACGKTPVMIHKDRPGQLGNRLQMALVREAANIIGEGIASAEDIDLAMKRGLGLRYPAYGLLEHQDIVGLDLVGAICEYVGRDLYAGQDAPQYLKTLIADGRIGAKAGQGFLTWPEGKADEVRARRDKFLIEFLRSQSAEA